MVNPSYIVEYIVRVHADESPEILHSSFITLQGTMDTECYFSECVTNAQPKDFLPNGIENGIHRLVFKVNSCCDNYWSSYGYEYDAWEEYELLNQYTFNEKEAKCYFNDDERDDERAGR